MQIENFEHASGHARQQEPINWVTTGFMALFHVGAIAALFMFSWRGLIAAAVLWWISGSLGIGLGYHRLLTHRGYRTSKAMEYLMTVCGTLALEGGAINWVVTHRMHHARTDISGVDPHTPRDGRWWAHAGWILRGTAQQHDEETLRRYAPDLTRDRIQVLINKFWLVPTIVSGLALLALGGWSMLMWGLFFRVTIGLHATWLVNSATHLWGTRRFATKDDSTNSWWVALISFGEGWHNNHHAYPVSARHGLAWYELDLNWMAIRALEMLGLVSGVKAVNIDGRMRGEAREEAQELRRAA